MQFIRISHDTKLDQLSDIVGPRNVDSLLHINGLKRHPNIGKQLSSKCKSVMSEEDEIDWQRKLSILNTFTEDSDVFEYAALSSDSSWKVLSAMNTFPGMLKIPENDRIPDSEYILGNGETVSDIVYRQAVKQLQNPPHYIDPSIFNEYSTVKPSQILNDTEYSNKVFQWFKIPWGEVTLYSSLSDSSLDFPVFPEETSDSVHANYMTMPDIIYQYEPWQLYTGSGPRSNTYEFDFHRDMWTGDHRDGKANELIRFCMANCYPEYRGSAVNTSLVTLYIHGKALIQGVMTDVSVSWDGPLGLDMWYLHCKLSITITEVSPVALNYGSMMMKPLIS